MTLSVIAAIVYGSITMLGGILGYLKARSLPSLISGIISGILLLVSAIMQIQAISGGKTLSVVISLLLVIVFVIRLIKTKKFMPSGLMIIIGVACLAMMAV